jgi:hypothetical protein
MSTSNKLGMNQSNGSNLLGMNSEHRRETAVFMVENETTPSATTLDVVEIAPHASPSNKLGINLIERIEFVGKNASIATRLPCLW